MVHHAKNNVLKLISFAAKTIENKISDVSAVFTKDWHEKETKIYTF